MSCPHLERYKLAVNTKMNQLFPFRITIGSECQHIEEKFLVLLNGTNNKEAKIHELPQNEVEPV